VGCDPASFRRLSRVQSGGGAFGEGSAVEVGVLDASANTDQRMKRWIAKGMPTTVGWRP
jgi:hypothetical protein